MINDRHWQKDVDHKLYLLQCCDKADVPKYHRDWRDAVVRLKLIRDIKKYLSDTHQTIVWESDWAPPSHSCHQQRVGKGKVRLLS